MIKFRRYCKRGEGKSQGTTGAHKQGISVACENFAAKKAPLRKKASSTKPFRSLRPLSAKLRSCYKKGPLLWNHFAAQDHPLRKFSQLQNPSQAHMCHFAVQAPSGSVALTPSQSSPPNSWCMGKWDNQRVCELIEPSPSPCAIMSYIDNRPQWGWTRVRTVHRDLG